MLRTNEKLLVEMSVTGQIAHPSGGYYTVSFDGKPFISVGMSGITFNIKVGDPAFGYAWGEHIEPGVSIKNPDTSANSALNILSCIGNTATIISASLHNNKHPLKGKKGIVTGKHGGAERVLIAFSQNIIKNLCVGDKIQIRAKGVGLKFLDFPNIQIMNTSPDLLNAMHIKKIKNKIKVEVAKIVPGYIMGSGLGSTFSFRGDYDIQTTSEEAIKALGLENIRLGDIVAIQDHDCSYGPRWHKGAVTIGIVIHGRSFCSGHGPGVCALLTSTLKNIIPVINKKANIVDLLKLKL